MEFELGYKGNDGGEAMRVAIISWPVLAAVSRMTGIDSSLSPGCDVS